MNGIEILLDILVVYFVAILSVLIVKKLNQTPIIGYLIAGMIIGPSALHIVTSHENVEFLAEIGVIFFLFIVGLEFPMEKMNEMKKLLFGVGGGQVLLCSFTFFLILSFLTGFAGNQAIFIGLLFSISSTAIVMKLIIERSEQNSLYGRTSLAVLLFQDLMIVPIMILIPILAGSGESSIMKVLLIALVKATATIGLLFIIARYIFKPLITSIVKQRNPELFIITILFICLGTAVLTNQAGFSMILGAFIAGLLLSDTEFKHHTIAEFLPFRDSLLPIFFVSVGMLVDLHYLVSHIGTVFGFFLLLVIVKIVVMMLVLRVMNYPLRPLLTTSLALAQVGEFSFVLLLQGKNVGLLDIDLYQSLLSAVVLSMLVTPFLINNSTALFFKLAKYPILSKIFPAVSIEDAEEKGSILDDHVIVCGYGVTGRNIVRSLKTFDIPYIVLELNWSNVELGLKEGDNIIYADASRWEILAGVGLKKARALVMAISEVDAVLGTVKVARRINPELFILVRSRYVGNLPRFEQAGANLVITEEFETSLRIISELMGRFDFSQGEVDMLVQDIRMDHYTLFKTFPAGRNSENKSREGNLL